MLVHMQFLTLAAVATNAITVCPAPGVMSMSHTLLKGYRKPLKSRYLFFQGLVAPFFV